MTFDGIEALLGMGGLKMSRLVVPFVLCSVLIGVLALAACGTSNDWNISVPQNNQQIEVGAFPLSCSGTGTVEQAFLLECFKGEVLLSNAQSSTDDNGMWGVSLPRGCPWPTGSAEIRLSCQNVPPNYDEMKSIDVTFVEL